MAPCTHITFSVLGPLPATPYIGIVDIATLLSSASGVFLYNARTLRSPWIRTASVALSLSLTMVHIGIVAIAILFPSRTSYHPYSCHLFSYLGSIQYHFFVVASIQLALHRHNCLGAEHPLFTFRSPCSPSAQGPSFASPHRPIMQFHQGCLHHLFDNFRQCGSRCPISLTWGLKTRPSQRWDRAFALGK